MSVRKDPQDDIVGQEEGDNVGDVCPPPIRGLCDLVLLCANVLFIMIYIGFRMAEQHLKKKNIEKLSYFFLGASLLLNEEADDDDGVPVASNGLVLSGPARRLARKRFSQAMARRDNFVPRHSKPFHVRNKENNIHIICIREK